MHASLWLAGLSLRWHPLNPLMRMCSIYMPFIGHMRLWPLWDTEMYMVSWITGVWVSRGDWYWCHWFNEWCEKRFQAITSMRRNRFLFLAHFRSYFRFPPWRIILQPSATRSACIALLQRSVSWFFKRVMYLVDLISSKKRTPTNIKTISQLPKKYFGTCSWAPVYCEPPNTEL